MSVRIEAAKNNDFLKIAALDRLAWDEEIIIDGEHSWRIWCEYATLLVARRAADEPALNDTDSIAGALLMFPTTKPIWVLHKIMVHPDCRGTGIGSSLMKAALAQAPGELMLTVNPKNLAAVKLYENFGFTIREHVPGFYRPHEDRYVMVYDPTPGDLRDK